MSADGPEQRYLDQRELADIQRTRDEALEAEDSYDAAMDRELARADHLLDQHKEIDLDSPEFAAMVEHFMQRVCK